MNWTDKIQKVKTALAVAALAIALGSLYTSHRLTQDLSKEEISKMEVWAEAMRSLTEAEAETDLSLVLRVINSNNTIPVIVTDSRGDILASRNLPARPAGADSLATLRKEAETMREEGRCMRMDLRGGEENTSKHDYIYVYYSESLMLRRLAVFPYVQLGVAGFFMLLALFALLAFKRAEQNRVWVGLSRETAHQLGTPISSLMAWSEVLKETYPDDSLLLEMDKDIRRLQLVADRFSKIGSAPELRREDIRTSVERVVEYFDRRTSRKVAITVHAPEEPLPADINAPLFEWVIENLCKNAVDAMEGAGIITVTLSPQGRQGGVCVEVTDTGKGIAHKHFKSVFRPGFTTKKRGWGLGLSLAKRIIEEYHHGRIFVKRSEPGEGTTFAILLRPAANAAPQG